MWCNSGNNSCPVSQLFPGVLRKVRYANTAIFCEANYLENSCKQQWQIAMALVLSRKLCLSVFWQLSI